MAEKPNAPDVDPPSDDDKREKQKEEIDTDAELSSRYSRLSRHGSTAEALASDEPPSEAPVSSPGQPEVPPIFSIYTSWEKRLIVLAASLSAFFSPLTAQIYLPALTVLADDFGVSDAQINLTVTTYMIFQGITPMFIGGFADAAGRRPAYVICFVVYIAANIGLALCKDYASLLIVRCLQSAGSSTTVALCQAVVADIVVSADRGQYIGITAIPIVLAPSLGPVIGGLLAQYLGWRWIFWFLAITASVNLGFMLLFFPETCRRIVGDGSVRAHPIYRTFWQMIKDVRARRQSKRATAPYNADHSSLHRTTSTRSRGPALHLRPPNPLASLSLLLEKELSILLGYSAIVFAGFYAIATALPSQFSALYGLSDLQIGLMYLPLAGGSIVAAGVAGPLVNWNYRRHAGKLGVPVDRKRQADLRSFPIERARLEVGMPLLALSAAVMIAWGWAVQAGAHIAVPCVLLFLLGVGMIGFNNTSSVLIVDIYPEKAGAAVAANNLTRCLLGAAFSAFIVPMIDGIGAGWAYTIIGGLYIVFSPLMWAVMRKGMGWRAELREKEERRQEKKRLRKEAREAREAAHEVPGGQTGV